MNEILDGIHAAIQQVAQAAIPPEPARGEADTSALRRELAATERRMRKVLGRMRSAKAQSVPVPFAMPLQTPEQRAKSASVMRSALRGRRKWGLSAAQMELVGNVFCPTGQGGGVDPSCSPEGKVGEGNMGAVVRDGDYVLKNAVRKDGTKSKEGEIYDLLRGVEGVADGAQVGDKIRVKHYQEVLGLDAVPNERDRLGMGSVVGTNENVKRLLSAFNTLAEHGIDYNDHIQVGFDDDWKAHLLDFSNAGRNVPFQAETNNYSRLDQWLRDFGAESAADNVSDTYGAMKYLDFKTHLSQDKLNALKDKLKSDPKRSHLVPTLDKIKGKKLVAAYYSRNPRPVEETGRDIIQSDLSASGLRMVFSTAPLDADTIRQYNLMPVVHRPKRPTANAAEIRISKLAPYLHDLLGDVTKKQSRVIAQAVKRGIDRKWADSTVARLLASKADLDPDRAKVVARTEMARAKSDIALGKKRDSAKVVFVLGDEDACPICRALEGTVRTVRKAQGVIPVHPNCSCEWREAPKGAKVTTNCGGKGSRRPGPCPEPDRLDHPETTQEAENRINIVTDEVFGEGGERDSYQPAYRKIKLPGERYIEIRHKEYNSKSPHAVQIDFGIEGEDNIYQNETITKESLGMLRKIRGAVQKYHEMGLKIMFIASDHKRKELYDRVLGKTFKDRQEFNGRVVYNATTANFRDSLLRFSALNQFCATGEGGGVDPSCGSSGGKGTPRSVDLPSPRDQDATDADGNSLLKQDVVDDLNISMSRIDQAEQGHVSKRRVSRDAGADNEILNELAARSKFKSDFVGRGLVFDTEQDAANYVEALTKRGHYRTSDDPKSTPESFSDDAETARRFATVKSAQVIPSKEQNGHGVLVQILPKKGNVYRGYRLDYGEGEVILPRGQVYEVAETSEERSPSGFVLHTVKLKHPQ